MAGHQRQSATPAQHQRGRHLATTSNNKYRIRLGTVLLLFIALLTGLLLVGWRSVLVKHKAHNSNNNAKNPPLSMKKAALDSSISSSSLTGQLCHYEGHCPIGTTCVANPLSPQGGVCQPYRPNTKSELMQTQNTFMNTQDELLFEDCINQCRHELEWDEHFYYDIFHPKIFNFMRATIPSKQLQQQQRPPGCLLVFERLQGKSESLKDAKVEEWLKIRKPQRVVRVDPLVVDTTNNMSSSLDGIMWTALCYHPCKTDTDCGGGNGGAQYFQCLEGVCHRNPTYWLPFANANNITKTVLVTGANSGYWNGLVNFAASARFWAPHNPLVVYNLGLSAEQISIVKSWSNVIAVEWMDGIPYTPNHVHLLKTYAWKSLAMNESVHKYRNMFWLDAGATFTGPIDGLEQYLQRTGIFLVKGQDENMMGRASEHTFRYFHLDKASFQGGPHYAGGIQGHLLPSRYIDSIVKPNAACALVADCIAPHGASLGNHRYDQTSLSILAYGRYHKIPHHTEFLAASSSQLHSDLTQPNDMFMWTARQGCSFYSDREKQHNNNNNNNNNKEEKSGQANADQIPQQQIQQFEQQRNRLAGLFGDRKKLFRGRSDRLQLDLHHRILHMRVGDGDSGSQNTQPRR